MKGLGENQLPLSDSFSFLVAVPDFQSDDLIAVYVLTWFDCRDEIRVKVAEYIRLAKCLF